MLYPSLSFRNKEDLYWDNVVLSLPMTGANGSTTFTDVSKSGHNITAIGDAQISTAQSKFGGSSLALDGSGDFATVASSSDWAVSGNYTVEFFVRNNVISGPSFGKFILSSNRAGTVATTGWGFAHYEGQYTFGVNNTSSGLLGTFNTNTWYHMAAVWNSGVVTFYVDGVSAWSSSVADVQTTTAGLLVIGGSRELDSNRGLNGYIDDLRITKGVARYTSNFTPPTAAFPIG